MLDKIGVNCRLHFGFNLEFTQIVKILYHVYLEIFLVCFEPGVAQALCRAKSVFGVSLKHLFDEIFYQPCRALKLSFIKAKFSMSD